MTLPKPPTPPEVAALIPKVLTGVLRAGTNNYLAAHCPDAPSHLQVIHLDPSSYLTAKAGDRVELEYVPAMGGMLWVVSRVLA